MTGKILDKYVGHFKLEKVRLVSEKFNLVQRHIERTLFEKNHAELTTPDTVTEELSSSEESTSSVNDNETDVRSDNDEIVAFNGFESSSSSADPDPDPDTGDVFVPVYAPHKL